ncbi:Rad52/Rad22 family DNA repair protein [Paenibacillus sp. GYB003]|uniref:Rad52/Rad22 family DNA repair protein n=1 Tax=Paenibacillus sp. GYB003 TaxID=2994392 RepID=UPI002F964DA9
MSGGGLRELFNELNEPFSYEEYKVNFEGHVSVGPQSVADRLNVVFGIYDWSHDILDYKEDHEAFTVSVRGLLKVRDPKTGEWITRTQFGDKKIVMSNDASKPKAQSFLDAKKSAVSDSLKKCAALFGVASDVYKGRIKAVKALRSRNPEDYNELYLALAHYFSIDYRFDSNFEHGIPILPDDYKTFYESKQWNGIFESDKQTAWEWWKSQDKSKPIQQDSNKHNTAGTSNTTNSHPNGVGNREGKPTSSAAGNRPTNQKQRDRQENSPSNERDLEGQLYEFVDMIAGAHPETQDPFYKIRFKHQGKSVDVFVIDDNVIEYIEKINLQEGSKYALKTKPSERGKLILRHIRKAS